MRQTSGLGHASLCAVLLATKNMPQDAGPIAGRIATTTQYRAQHAADIQPTVVVLQCAQQGLRTFGAGGIAAQFAHQQRQGGADGTRRLCGVKPQLACDLLQGRAL